MEPAVSGYNTATAPSDENEASNAIERYEALKKQVASAAPARGAAGGGGVAAVTLERLVLAQQQNELLRREWENASDEAKRLASALQQERSRAERRYQALKKTSTEERAGRQAEVEAAVSAERARGEAEVRRLKEEHAAELAAARRASETAATEAGAKAARRLEGEVSRLQAEARERSALHASRLRALMDSEEEALASREALLARLQSTSAATLALSFRLRRQDGRVDPARGAVGTRTAYRHRQLACPSRRVPVPLAHEHACAHCSTVVRAHDTARHRPPPSYVRESDSFLHVRPRPQTRAATEGGVALRALHSEVSSLDALVAAAAAERRQAPPPTTPPTHAKPTHAKPEHAARARRRKRRHVCGASSRRHTSSGLQARADMQAERAALHLEAEAEIAER